MGLQAEAGAKLLPDEFDACPECGILAHLVLHMPVRQWRRSPPIPLRLLLTARPKRLTPVLQRVHRGIKRHLLWQVGRGSNDADSGALTLIQRFGAAAKLSTHLHGLVLHGVYGRSTDAVPGLFDRPAPAAAPCRRPGGIRPCVGQCA